MTRSRLVVGLLVAALAGCGGPAVDEAAPASTPAASPAPSAAPPAATVATLDVIDVQVAVRLEGAAAYDDGVDGDPLAIGDTVRTDAVGFGQVSYLDGSLTRIDVDSEVTILAAAAVAGAIDVEVSLDAGRAWNRIGDLGEDGGFLLRTDVGTAAVRGTAFEVDCRAVATLGCRFSVYEGTVEVTPDADDPVLLGPFRSLLVGPDGTVVAEDEIAADLSSPDGIDGDWVRRNDGLDTGGGGSALPIEEPAQSALVLGALHDCGGEGDATYYYRFFDGGEVIDVTAVATPAQVSQWFVATSEKASSANPGAEYGVGTWTLADGRLTGSTTEGEVTVTFDGTVADDGTITMTTVSSFNGNTSEVTCTPLA